MLAILFTVSTWSAEFTVDSTTYRKDYVMDSESGASTESLYVQKDGAWKFVASLYSDVDGNWTGRIGDQVYADLYDETVGDYVVIVGAETWPTWSDFDAALQALHFWDDGGMIYDIGIVDGGDLMVYALSATTGNESQVQTSEARPGQKGLLVALGKADSPKARIALLTALVNPTPHDAFPALSRPGKSNRK